jgi:predicted amidohydrolase
VSNSKEVFALVEEERIRGGEASVKAAVVQLEPRVGYKRENIERTLELIEEAAENGAGFVVLPELCTTGYAFNSRKELAEVAEEVPGGSTIEAWSQLAAQHELYLVAGIAERENLKLYNSAVLVGPDGVAGCYRKPHLWYEEQLFFEPGDTGFPVFLTPFGRVGIQICYDIWFPEGTRILAEKGADIIAVTTNWVANPAEDAEWRNWGYPMAVHVAVAQSNMNQVFMACADRVGTERGIFFPGSSVITGPEGWPLAGPASTDAEEILYAELNLTDARRAKSLTDLNHALHDRRLDMYDRFLGYREEQDR